MTTARFLLAVLIIIVVAAAAAPGGAANSSKRSTTAGRAAANGYAPLPAPPATCTWTGTTDTDWATGTNWTGCTGGGVPAAGDPVTIGAVANQPTLSTSEPTLSTVTIDAGGTLTVSVGGVLDTNVNFSLNGGTLSITGGVVNVGVGAETNLLYTSGSSLTISSGALNIGGRLSPSTTTPDTITYNQSNGTVTVATFASNDGSFGSFSIPATGSSFTISGGKIILEQATATISDYVVLALTSSVTGGEVQFGDSSTSAAGFGILTTVPIFNLTMFGPSVTNLSIHGDVAVISVLKLDGGVIKPSGSAPVGGAVIVGAAGSITRTAGWVIAALEKDGLPSSSFTFHVGTSIGYTPLGLANISGGGDLRVKTEEIVHPSVNGPTSLQEYWTLTKTGSLTTDLTFTYLLGDIQGTEANYRVIRISGGTPVSFPTTVLDTMNHTASITGVSSFSDWTVGESLAPTAAPVRISGQITTTDGRPLGGVVVGLNGNSADVTITDGNGQYLFAEVEADGFYTVTPALANYHFSPANRSFSLLADRTDAVFSASRDAAMTTNPIDTNEYFVRQQYLDFLNREPDQGGFDYWTAQLNQCRADQDCVRARRLDVSAAFFGSEEFQETGSFIYRLYRAALGRQLSYNEFSTDRKQVVAGADLAASKAAFAAAFVERPEFVLKYQGNVTAESFVDALLQTTGIDLSSERSNLIAKYNSAGTRNESRSLVVGDVAAITSFSQAIRNQSFVLMEYFGYLQRDVDSGGYDFWVHVLENGPRGNYRPMVCAFITSAEYQRRFSSVITRGNAECGR